MAESEWYDYRAINSRNAMWAIVAGPRSIGKTYGKKLAKMKAFIATGEQTLWLRRTRTELVPAKSGFFDSIAPLYPGFDFRVNGDLGEIKGLDGGVWQTVFRFAALSTSAQLKGTEFSGVAEIVYDECFAEPGMPYLPEELERLRGLWVTVNRSRAGIDGRSSTRVTLLGNVHTLDNPYFLEFGLDGTREWQKADGGNLILHMVDAKKYVKRVTKSMYGNLLGVAAMDYAEGQYFLPDGGYVVDERPADSKPFATLVTLRGVFGLWLTPAYDAMFCTVGPLATQDAPVVAFEPLAVRPGVVYAEPGRFIRGEARRHYRHGSLFLVTPGAMAARQALAR
jgi:hypothetical protein